MKHLMQRLTTHLIVVLSFGLVSASFGASVNVDFGQQPVSYSGTGAAPDSGTNWTRISNTVPFVFNLADSGGTPTTLGVEFDISVHGITMIDWTTPQVAPNLMRDYLYAFYPLVDQLWINGLDTNKRYDLYLYSQNGADSRGGTTFTANGIEQTVKYPVDSPNFVMSETATYEYGNYVRYLGVSPDPSGEIAILYTDAMGFAAAFNGFQILEHIAADFDVDRDVDNDDLSVWEGSYSGSGADADGDGDSDGFDFLIWQQQLGTNMSGPLSSSTAVPEPASYWLVVLGAVGLCCWRHPLRLRKGETMFQPNSQPIARFSVAALLLGLASACFGASVNVDFGQFPIPYSGTAVAPDSGTYWSRVPNTSSSAFPLADSSGTLTSVGVEIPNYLQMADWTTPQVAPNLMKDYLYAFNAGGIPYPLSITGLDPSKEYDLYLYSKNGGGGAATGSTTKFIVNGIQKTVANSDNIPNFVLGDNYTLYSGVGPAVDGRLLVEYLDVGGVGAALNGFQLVANVDPNEHPLPPLPPGRGRQLLLQRGLQIQAFELTPTFDFDVDRWLTANFTGINFQFDANVMHPLLLARLPQGHQWGRWFGGLDVTPDELPYIDDFVSFQYWDELDGQFGKPALLDVLPEVEAKYREWNNLYPNTLTMTTSWGGYLNASDLRTYMRATEPDMLFYDFFPGFFATRETWYEEMQKFRTVALEGYDGSGRQPLPYGQQPQASRTSYSDQLPGEAFVRQQQFASWAFGFTYLAQWLYRDPLHIPAPGQEDLFTQMFASRGDHRPTIMFDYVAETNRQSRNLGPALVRMVSTDVRIIPGKVNGTANPPVFGVPTWIEGDQNTGGYTDFLTDIVPLGKDFLNPDFNNHSDAIVGYFKPLLDENSGFTFVDGLSFMIVNGNAGGTTTRIVNGQPFDAMGFNVYVDQNGEPDPVSMAANSAEALGEWYHVAFDFQNSNIDSLLRLSRDTGEVEVVPLIHFADSRYFFTLFLPGGTGDLFAYWDSSLPLPTVGSIAVAVPEPASYWLVVFTAVGLCCSRRLLSP